jgi:hypothetical protein
VATAREPIGDLCGVRDHGHRRLKCGGLEHRILDVPSDHGNVELHICELHYQELKASDDPIQLAREWV